MLAEKLQEDEDLLMMRPMGIEDEPAATPGPCSPGTYLSCLIDGLALPPGHIAIVIPASGLDVDDAARQKHQAPSYLRIHATLQMYRRAPCDGKVKMLLDLFHSWPKLLIGLQRALMVQHESLKADQRRELKASTASWRKQVRRSTNGSASSSGGTASTSLGLLSPSSSFGTLPSTE